MLRTTTTITNAKPSGGISDAGSDNQGADGGGDGVVIGVGVGVAAVAVVVIGVIIAVSFVLRAKRTQRISRKKQEIENSYGYSPKTPGDYSMDEGRNRRESTFAN